MDLKKIIEENKEELIEILRILVSHNSVEKKNEENTPFGVINRNCLKKALEIGTSYGLKSKNLDDYCGYLELGEGRDTIGIATHLDIVPAGNNWNTDPFVLTEKDGYLYGRGTSDDKGAAASSIIALKIIKELNLDLNHKKVRLIFGCNEETGSKCMEHYNKVEGPFTYGFTPDSEFPCVNGEKGHIKCTFNCTDTTILEIKGGNAFNVVCDRCTLSLPKDTYNEDKLKEYMKENALQIEIKKESNTDSITVIGKSSHASLPHLGINAITHMMYGLKEAAFQDNFINSYCELIDRENTGRKMGIGCTDKYGSLTMINGTIDKIYNEISGTIDIRVPVTISTDEIKEKLESIKNEYIKLNIDSSEKSIFFEEDSHLVKSLMKAYQNVTHDYDTKPSISGGGTYAKTLENCVAFGCEFKDNENNIHDANERVKISELLLQVELYINAILELVK